MTRALAAALLVLSCLLSATAVGAGGEGSGAADSLAFGRAGLEHFEAGRFAEARASFTAADSRYHTPVFVLYIARSNRALKRLLQARAGYDSVLAEQLSATDPQPWRQAQADARSERRALLETIPKVTVTVDVPAAEVSLSVGGKPATVGSAVELDPGSHVVEARYAGQTTRRDIALEPGEHTVVKLELRRHETPSPNPSVPRPIETPVPKPLVTPPSSSGESGSGGLVVGAGLLLGFGAAGLVVGAVTGALALSEAEAARKNCTEDAVCPTANEPIKDRALGLAHASTASLAVGGALAITGVILLVMGLTGDTSEAGSLDVTPYGLVLIF